LPVNLQAIFDASIIELDTIDSTNNYAMRLIDADTAQEGMTIQALQQSQGKGQRGNAWYDEPGKNLLMSIIVRPQFSLSSQFLFNVAATTAIIKVLQNICENITVQVKWPNDIIINDKKAGGVLIENVLRGSSWNYSVIGIGLNINQVKGFDALPYATSLGLETQKNYDVKKIASGIRLAVLQAIYSPADNHYLMQQYNDNLFKKDATQLFHMDGREWNARVVAAVEDGRLQVINPEGEAEYYTHGTQLWKWQ
jgi:BirA family biotin operon repressor/biotin-[acetyl-CoA-carboxylase] ligase